MSTFEARSRPNREPLLEQLRRGGSFTTEPATSVIDPETFRFIEGDRLFSALDFHTTRTGSVTRIGQTALQQSLTSPVTSAEQIREKQEALRELDNNPRLRSRLGEYLARAIGLEQDFLDYFRAHYRIGISKDDTPLPGAAVPYGRGDLYKVFNGTRAYLTHIAEGAKAVDPKSEYLQTLVGSLEGFKETDVYEYVEDTPYRVRQGLKSRSTKGVTEPAIHFNPTDRKVLFRAAAVLAGFLSGYESSGSNLVLCQPLLQCEDWRPFLNALQGGAWSALTLGIVASTLGRLIPRWFDNKIFVRPMHRVYFGDQYQVNPALSDAVDSIGLLYELNSLDVYGRQIQGSKTLPEIVDSETHHFVATNMKKPSKVAKNPGFITNSIELNGIDPEKSYQRITFLTGPNSGGKTELATTIAQIQLLAQIGGWVPAQHAEISPADLIFYQAPMAKREGLDEVGRLEAELTRLRDAFLRAVRTPKSLIIIDEPIEATTDAKKLAMAADIFKRFAIVGCTTIGATNNSGLVRGFESLGIGQFLQAGFEGGLPTYRFKPGISDDSHPEWVARKIGFTPEDMDAILREHGFIQ